MSPAPNERIHRELTYLRCHEGPASGCCDGDLLFSCFRALGSPALASSPPTLPLSSFLFFWTLTTSTSAWTSLSSLPPRNRLGPFGDSERTLPAGGGDEAKKSTSCELVAISSMALVMVRNQGSAWPMRRVSERGRREIESSAMKVKGGRPQAPFASQPPPRLRVHGHRDAITAVFIIVMTFRSRLHALRVALWGPPPASAQEAKLIRKIDFLVLTFTCLMYWCVGWQQRYTRVQ